MSSNDEDVYRRKIKDIETKPNSTLKQNEKNIEIVKPNEKNK